MGTMQVMITRPTQLSIRDCQLVIRGETEREVPIEDISCLLIDDQRTTATTAVLAKLSENGVAVFFCSEKHLPCALTLPVFGHPRAFYRMHLLLEASEPIKKQIWQSIVMQKIRNQAFCLALCGMGTEAEALYALSRLVKSGDSGNLEAIAARAYFQALFGTDFSRGQDSRVNAALNYGYAVMRGSIARYLTMGGYYPAIGLFHHSGGNNFNLADDMIEPFRPLVDLHVYFKVDRAGDLTFEDRKAMFNVLNAEMQLNGHRVSADNAIQNAAWALERALREKPHTMPALCLTGNSLTDHKVDK